MSWLRIDEGFVEHEKVLDLSDRAFRLHVAGLCYCARNLTDGRLSPKAVKVVCALTASSRRHLVELRDAGLWLVDDDYRIKDYLDYNPDAETVKERRSANADRQRRWREEHRDDVTGQFGNTSDNASGNDPRNALGNAAPSPDPGPTPKDLEPTEPVGDGSGKVHSIDRLRAAARLYAAIPEADRDEGTERVVLGYASELDVAAFDEIRRSLVRKIGRDALFKTAGAYVNGALQKAARKAHGLEAA